MHINRTAATTAKPCMRDMAELNQLLAPAAEVLKAVPLKHVKRRLNEIVAERPHLAEEAPLAFLFEKSRRARFAQPLQLAR